MVWIPFPPLVWYHQPLPPCHCLNMLQPLLSPKTEPQGRENRGVGSRNTEGQCSSFEGGQWPLLLYLWGGWASTIPSSSSNLGSGPWVMLTLPCLLLFSSFLTSSYLHAPPLPCLIGSYCKQWAILQTDTRILTHYNCMCSFSCVFFLNRVSLLL